MTPSAPPTAINSAFGATAVARAGPPTAYSTAGVAGLVPADQRRTVRSKPPAATCRPSGDTATAAVASVGPASTDRVCSSAGSITWTFPFPNPATTNEPFGDAATARMPSGYG